MPNKYRYDVKNCYYCPGTRNADGSITFDETRIRQEPGLQSIDMQAEGDISKIRADGIDYIIIASNNGYTGTLNFVKISDQFRQDCLAETADITTGIQYEDADATPDPFALMGEFKGDTEGIRFIYYNCTASRPNRCSISSMSACEYPFTARHSSSSSTTLSRTKSALQSCGTYPWFAEQRLRSFPRRSRT